MNTEWKPISEAPKNCLILACEPGIGYGLVYWEKGPGGGMWVDDNGDSMRPTHWISLPDWPVEVKRETLLKNIHKAIAGVTKHVEWKNDHVDIQVKGEISYISIPFKLSEEAKKELGLEDIEGGELRISK